MFELRGTDGCNVQNSLAVGMIQRLGSSSNHSRTKRLAHFSGPSTHGGQELCDSGLRQAGADGSLGDVFGRALGQGFAVDGLVDAGCN